MRQYFLDQAIEIDPREEKLPAWARDKLKTMRRAATEACKELSDLRGGSPPGPLWLSDWDGGKRFYLPAYAGQLCYGDPNAEHEELSLQAGHPQISKDHLIITARNMVLTVRPHCSNVVMLSGCDQ
jgi:hypothetical protein